MNQQKRAFMNEWSVVPAWSKALAVVLACGLAVVVFWAIGLDETRPPLPLQILGVLIASAIVATLVMLIGYVNRDAGRRGMSRVLWTFVVIFVPNALGFILYFLLRRPLLGSCPGCGATVQAEFNYCPNCNYQLGPTCQKCGRSVQPADLFCARCGAALNRSVPEDP